MYVPFFFTKYANSKLATLVSILGGVLISAGVALGAATVMAGEYGGTAAGVVLGLIGWGISKAAEGISDSKAKKAQIC